MKKSILLVRTSTDRQEIETQIKELTEYARDFDKESKLIPIGSSGASAVKEDELYLFNLQKVFDEIEKGDVVCVYAWEISRIGRQEETLMKFKNFLIKHGVNLRIKNPSLELINKNGEVNGGVELAFSLFATMAKQEALEIKKRFKRGKERNKREGKYIGGVLLYGYRVVKEGENKGRFIIYEPEAENVRKIYMDYLGGNDGIVKVGQKYNLHVGRILKNKHYYGDENYPAIITKEVFDAVEEKRHQWHNQPREKGKKYIDYLHGLTWCEVVDFEKEKVELYRMSIMRSKNHYANQKFSVWANINMLDSLAVRVLQDMLDTCDFSAFENAMKERKEDINRQIKNTHVEIEALNKKYDKLEEDYYIRGRVKNFAKYEAIIKAELETKQNTLLNLQTELVKVEENKFEKPNLYSMTDTEKKATIQHYIQAVVLTCKSSWDVRPVNFILKNMEFNGVTVFFHRYKYAYPPTDPEDGLQWRDVPRIEKEYFHEYAYTKLKKKNKK